MKSRRIFYEPFLASNPWVGFLIFLIAGAGLAFLTVQVIDKGPLTRWDQPAIVAIHNYASHQPGWYVLLMRIFSTIGREGIAILGVAMGIGFIRAKQDRELGYVILGIFGGELAFEIISNLVGRARPEFKDPFETLLGPGYPSGHMTTAVLITWMIVYLLWHRIQHPVWRWVILIINVFMVIAIAWSRLFIGVHYPTDVVGGILLGLAWGGLVYTLIDLYFYRVRVRQGSKIPAAEQ
jgi:membrane-associated phospholipid phosphatase